MKPTHLGKDIGDQFQDASIVSNYRKRPAYQASVFKILQNKLPEQGRLVDLGCGTGEVSIPLSRLGFDVNGVDPSAGMIKLARKSPSSVSWHCSYAEDYTFPENVDLVVCANSLHWMDWPKLFPKIKASLNTEGQMAVITGGEMFGYPQSEQVLGLVKQFSTTKNFTPYSLIDLLSGSGLFTVAESMNATPEPLAQPLDQFIASFHARNGFSLDRMAPEAAQEFDQAMYSLLAPHTVDGAIGGFVQATITFGEPV